MISPTGLQHLVATCVAMLLLCSCVSFDPRPEAPEITIKKTLGQAYFEPMPLDFDPLPDEGLQNLRNAYVTLLEILTDPATRQIVQYRLADLELLLAEQEQEAGTRPLDNAYYELAIAQYENILQQHPNQAQNAQVLYQLAKSYDLQGQSDKSLNVIEQMLSEYPDTPYAAELYFRKGEMMFGRGNYPSAIKAYSQVLDLGTDTDYFMAAAYMLGWSYYKTDQQHQALLAFTQLLDVKLPNSVINEQMLRQLKPEQQLELLPVGEKRLVNDSIRIIAQLFSFQAAEQSIAEFYNEIGERHYENLVYEQLGQQFLNEDRYRDSAKVFRAFTEVHPAHNQAPFFAVKQIDAYILGEFPTLVLPAKQDFVQRYGMEGPYWVNWGQLLQDDVKPFLKEYLQELAQYQHSKAQLLTKAVNQQSTRNNKEKVAENQQNVLLSFAEAAQYYRSFINTFPVDDATPQMVFNLAESLFDGKNYIDAIEAYERYAYQYSTQANAAEAGYAAILAYRALRETLSEPSQQQKWQDQQLLSQRQFVQQFADDPRAVDVLYDSMQQQFDLQHFFEAIDSAQALLAWQPEIDPQRKLASQLVVAHSHFAMQQFASAEQSFEGILRNLPNSDPRYQDLMEKMAASIYQQAEINLSKQYLSLAVDDLLRVIEKAPDSNARLTAQYDAATYLLELKQWQQATDLLQDFRIRFADHPLAANIGDKLIYAYQQSERWLPAAEELRQVWRAQKKSEIGRQALYVAAQYYHKAGNRDKALDSYRSYAHAYPQPFDEAMEARFALSEYYLESQEPANRRYWLNKLVKADANAGKDRTERSRYLAALASMVFANDATEEFDRIKLTLPLKTSLNKKRAALDAALKQLNQTLEYKIAEFSTIANYKIAHVYDQLAKDLMASERPKGLNDLELEQYGILLEEQAYPFEEQAIDVHEANAKRSWQGVYDEWVKRSFAALSQLSPGRYDKVEELEGSISEIY